MEATLPAVGLVIIRAGAAVSLAWDRVRLSTARRPGMPSSQDAMPWTGRLLSVILPDVRDLRLITSRRGGLLSDEDHQLLAMWAAQCAEHVLDLFETEESRDIRPRQAIDAARSWARGEMAMWDARACGGHAMGAARPVRGAARFAAYAAGQAACVAHVPEHDLGAAAYAIKAVRLAKPDHHDAGRRERDWQRDQLPAQIRELVLEDQVRRNAICWHAFDDD